MNQKFSEKQEVFSYCKDWLSNLISIDIVPRGKDEWNSFGLFLFWLNHFNYNTIKINLSEFEFKDNLCLQPLDVISHTLYALRKYNIESLGYVEITEKIFLQRLSEKYSIICIEQNDDDISCHYLFDIIDEDFETDESDYMNAKSMEIIELLRFAFPDKEHYNSNGVGHHFSFLPNIHDSSVKQIPQKNLPLKPLVEVNSTYLNLFEYSKRPTSWQIYVSKIIDRRSLLIDAMSKMTKAFTLYHKQKHLKPLADYVHDYTENYHQIIKRKSIPKLPQNIIDEWGEHGEGNAKKVKSIFDSPSNLQEKEEAKEMLALKKYSLFVGVYRDFDSAVENFLWQSAESIYRKIKIFLNEDISGLSDNARVSLVGNLFRAFEFVIEFQKEFRTHFAKFVDPIILKKIETAEIDNISILSVLYRQFIYSDSFIMGNAAKIAITRHKEIESNIKKKISNGLRQLAKELAVKIKVEFDKKTHRCIILLDYENTIESFQLLELIYNKLFDVIGQPDYTSIKYLHLNTKYPIFNIVLLVSGKTINSTWYEFKTYNLREKKIDKLEQFNFIPQKIPLEFIEKYTLKSWNNELEEFVNLDKLLESTSMAYQLAFHFSQLKYFEDKTIEDYNEKILRNHVGKTGGLFQENLQKALDLFGEYAEHCNQEKIKFVDDEEKFEFFEMLLSNHKFFYPNDTLFEKGEMKFTLGIEEINEWIPRLEQLVNNMSVIYYFLAGKVIEKEMIKLKNK